MRIQTCLVIISALVLSACSASGRSGFDAATTNPSIYQSRNFIDVQRMGGYGSELIARDRYQIDVRTNTVTSPERAVGIALARAGEMASENGYDYFRIEALEVKMSCARGGMESATPLVDLIAKAGDLDTFAAQPLVFDVAKISANLKPKLLTTDAASAIASRVALANRNRCGSRSAFGGSAVGSKMPWEIDDILYREDDADPTI